MWYPLVLVVKYRRKVITDDISDWLHEMFTAIGKSYNIQVQEWNHDKDHIHVLLKGQAAPIEVIKKYIERQGEKS